MLAVLDPDRNRAGLKYETLRRKLVRFFAWRNCDPAEELADETLDRVSRKLQEGLEIRLPDPGPYVYGVARNVVREAQAKAARMSHPVPLGGEAADLPDPASEEPGAEDLDRSLHCLDGCLEAMPIETRQLVLLYHSGQGRGPHRERLLEGLRISPGTLWVRMHRLRKRLERCVRDCLDAGFSGPVKGNGRPRHPSTKEADEP